MKPSDYRCTDYCNNCPFIDNGSAMHLVPGRVDSIKADLLEDGHFVCHKTVYDLDESMQDTEPQERKMCYGAYKFLKDKDKPNEIMRLAYTFGVDKRN